jgi:hypothetical protein
MRRMSLRLTTVWAIKGFFPANRRFAGNLSFMPQMKGEGPGLSSLTSRSP